MSTRQLKKLRRRELLAALGAGVGAIVKSTQIAFRETVTAAVYASGAYAAHGQNTQTNNANDNVFSDASPTSSRR